ncbi:store-operated calcium entry-associated regulatory factor [Triangularia verruculosa]|uniref:Store-operated calcium entry-associated regulatory factor n=1 Tax=Triangularia verruculosa TaxID=2587418 RepID=A0AAN7AZ69_9PEZI|nr:store-operated calcium entry-associated regulatory factor [Triangularia verruculosa]
MHLPSLSTPAALALAATTLFSFSTAPAAAAKPPNAILLSQVRSLTLKSTSLTTSRRVSPIPQLKCAGPSPLCSLPSASITTMRCTNTGSSYTSEDIEWSCAASLPSTLRLDRTEVICEGYDSPDDPYVLKGSCGVEYTLQLTDEGRERYPNLVKGGGGWGKSATKGEEETDWSGVLFGILFVGVLLWILIGACTSWGQNGNNTTGRQPRRNNGGGGGGGWGGGGNNDNDDPPPPYPGTGGSNNTRRPKTTNTSSSSSSSRQSQEQGWRPGFWTGLGTGAAGGYMAGQHRSNTNTFGGHNAYDDNTYGSRWGGSDRFGGGSGWGGAGPSRSSSSRDSGPSHESTGYGSTSRR